MTRINLLPHRELRRERRRKDFYGQIAVAALIGVFVAIVTAFVIDSWIETQQARNRFIEIENKKLDAQITEIAQLKQEIEDLKSRKLAVEELQRERTLPIHVLDDLVRHLPEGIYFKQVKQQEHKVLLIGVAQSNERVSNLLHSLSSEMPWLERPELIEIRAVQIPKSEGREARAAYEFSLNVYMKTQFEPAPAGARPASAQPPANAPAPAAQPKAAR